MITNVAILGATGYGGGELLRLLLLDPKVVVTHATSRTRAGVPIAAIHKNLSRYQNVTFSDPSPDEIMEHADFIFGALPHGAAAEALAPYIDAGKRVIDLSGDFRLRSAIDYKKWYRKDHPRPDLLSKAVYGAPEKFRDQIREAHLVASPGCFATAINLALLPAAEAGLLAGDINVVALTGSSGSGAEPTESTHHPTRAATLRPYKVLAHQHTPEITQLLHHGSPSIDSLVFTPISAPIVRGIIAVITAPTLKKLTQEEMETLYHRHYANSAFIRVLRDREPECAVVAGTNECELRVRVTASGELHVICAIDNLIKGGAGQAVESFYLMTGRDPVKEALPLAAAGLWP